MQALVYLRDKNGQTTLACTIDDIAFPLELGRQTSDSEQMYRLTWLESRSCWRMVIARGSEQTVGRGHALLELLPMVRPFG